MTYNKSRVFLKNGADLKVKPESDYINACYVNSPFGADTKIIASQGPLPETTNDFWQMIIENNVTLVVSTCKIQENGRAKCNQFWPSKNQTNQFCIS